MLTGAHVVAYAHDPEAARAFFAETWGLPSVDAGGGWLIFALPPAEVAVHPTDGPPHHELFLMCDDLDAALGELHEKGVEPSGPLSEERWGRVARIPVPGLGDVGLYEPRHPRPPSPA